ncbi:MAG: DUF4491 family protein [Chloroflexota bacterium]
MELNFLGLIAAVTAFFSIWIGHVSVRKIEAVTVKLWKPIITAIALGVTLGYAALAVSNRPLSTVCGILGITLLWDAFEIKRQAQRIRKGHAPANPNNPRHAAMLATAGSQATTLDVLKRDPIGRPVSHNEAIQLIVDH